MIQTPIYFGGSEGSNGPESRGLSIDQMFQEFAHYIATIWIHEHEVPESPEELASFDVVSLIPEYKSYVASGGHVPTERGSTIEETWKSFQLMFREPHICVINSQQPSDPTSSHISRKILMMPEAIAKLLEDGFASYANGRSATATNPDSDLRSRGYQTLVFDGKMGHVILVQGFARYLETFLYWDPWPTATLLYKENNHASVNAIQVPSGERQWLLSEKDFQRVVYAIIIPLSQWEKMMNATPSQPSSSPSSAEMMKKRVQTLLAFCERELLLEYSSMKGLEMMYQRGGFSIPLEDSRILLDVFEEIAVNGFLQKCGSAMLLDLRSPRVRSSEIGMMSQRRDAQKAQEVVASYGSLSQFIGTLNTDDDLVQRLRLALMRTFPDQQRPSHSQQMFP